MDYQVINRPKLSRNKYGEVENKGTVGGANSLFSPTSSSYTEGGGNSENIRDFIGSTATEDGIHGLVPAPKSNVNEIQGTLNDNVKFLKGNGTWVDIPISRYTSENHNKDGVDLNGNLTVSDTLTTQTLNVLGAAHFWELIIDKVKAAGGNILITPANMEVDFVGEDIEYEVDENSSPYTEMFYNEFEGTGIYGLKTLFSTANIVSLTAKRVYMKNDDGTHKTLSEFEIGDMVRCKTVNLGNSDGTAFSNKDYWTFVLAVGSEAYLGENCIYIDIFKFFTDSDGNTYGLGTLINTSGIQGNVPYSNNDVEDGVMIPEFKFGYGTFNPEVGDNIVSLGHLWNGERQGAIILSSIDPMDTELKPPSIAQYKGIRTFGLLNRYRTTIISADNNEFQGSFLVNYNGNYIDINERMNIFSTDITTGLEKVGIHLDGENSTIKMVGSVEVRQNGDNDIDTLTVWDDDGKMRVKISPEQIPLDAINPETTQYFSSISGRLYPSGTITEHHTWREFIWSWNHKWEYYLTDASLNLSQTLNLGAMTTQDKITVSDFSSSISTRALFKGTNYTSNRGSQSISSVIMRLQRYSNGNWVNVSSENITSSSTIEVSAEFATINYSSAIFNNREITTAGNYRLKLDIVFNVYASITFDSQQSNPYYYFDTSVVSKAKVKKPTDSLTLIGRDGIVFHTENTDEYFKASESGIEMKWGDASIALDSSKGLKLCHVIETLTSSNTQISETASIVDATGFTSDTTIYLPSASTYGVGRELIIYGNDYVRVALRYSGKILVPKTIVKDTDTSSAGDSSYPYSETSSLPLKLNQIFELANGDGYDRYKLRNPVIRLINLGTNWLCTNYLAKLK